ncbi:MAG: proline--tRNA ligase [Planctomycetota bacterium]
MRWTKTFIPTLRDLPKDAVIPSHALMLKAGYIKQLARGTYTYLPLGWRSLRKAEAIVREEMDSAGAIEIHMPALQPIELWRKTGRDAIFGPIMFNFADRKGDINVLGPTHEEVVTSIVAECIDSYKQLPITLYQIQNKFRDEIRPRFGVMRGREFCMKDAYSFDPDTASLDESYRKMFDAYHRIFNRAGLKTLAVEADSGAIGGDSSCEFMVPADSGEDVIAYTDGDSYAANLERAATAALTPSNAGEAQQTVSEVHTPGASRIEDVAAFLKLSADRFIKTLIYVAVSGDQRVPFIVLLRGDHEACETKIAKRFPDAVIEMADDKTVEAVSGASVGFAGPVGLKQQVAIYADASVEKMINAVTGANKSGYHIIGVNPGRDFQPLAYGDFRNAQSGDSHPVSGKPYQFARGIEVGHVFKLGKKYSTALNASFLTQDQKREICWMGCYGIGVDRIVASAIEQKNDDKGMILPISLAPYHVIVTPLNIKKAEEHEAAETLYAGLQAEGIEVLFDDRDQRAGVKFNDADLVGIPWRVTIGGRGLSAGIFELKRRDSDEIKSIAISESVQTIAGIIRNELSEAKR